MKKKELLSITKMKATEKIKKMVHDDIVKIKYSHRDRRYRVETYERYLYFRAIVKGDVLKVAVFTRKLIAKREYRPQFEIYINKKENCWITYAPLERKWYTAKIDRLKFTIDDGWVYGNKPFATERTKKIVNDFFETGEKEVWAAILSFQNNVRSESLKRKHMSELQEIDEIMNVVPEQLPKDFKSWVKEEAFIKSRYIFYKGKEGKCSHCKEKVELKEKAQHNKKGKCPVCGSRITYKAWNRQKKVANEINVGLMQKLTDNSAFVLRNFYCKVEYTKVADEWVNSFSGMWESVRVTIPKCLRYIDQYFEFREYRYTGIDRWCHTARRYQYYYSPGFGSAVMYPRNLTKLLRDTELKYIPIKDMLNAAKGERTNFVHMLQELLENPRYEYLIKAGLKRFTYDMCKNYRYNTSKYIDPEQKKPWKYLKLSKEVFSECCKKNASRIQVRVAQLAEKAKVRVKWNEIEWIAEHIGPSTLIDDMKYTTANRMIKYLISIGAEKEGRTVMDYTDYIEQCKKLGWEMNRDTMFPQNFQIAHEQASQLIAEKEEKAAAEKKRLMDVQYKMKMEQKKALYDYEDGGIYVSCARMQG